MLLQQCLSIDLFSYWTPSHGQEGPWIRSVLLSRSFVGIGSLFFSGTQHGLRGPFGVMTELDFFKKLFLLPKMEKIGQSLGSLNVYENLVIIFFSIYSIKKEVYINCCMLGKILGNLDSWYMYQNGLGQSDRRIFKSTMSLEQSDEKVKWVWPLWFQKSRIDCISQRN